jgi:hypothetical protein
MIATPPIARQIPLALGDISDAVAKMAQCGTESRGAVFTRREVVEFILDLAGYASERPLQRYRLLEPSFGDGDFLVVAVERLMQSYRAQLAKTKKAHALILRDANQGSIVQDLGHAIRGVELNHASVKRTRKKLLTLLLEHNVTESDAYALLDLWLVEGDFLLTDLPHPFTHAVGNPPYVRQELIPPMLLAEYRTRYATLYDRADLYVPFIEHTLTCLAPDGILGFICSDRWMKNKYGGPLRAMVTAGYHLAAYVDMVDTPAFHSDVIAYPAITIIKREEPGPTRIAHRPPIARDALQKLSEAMRTADIPVASGVLEILGVAQGQEPWILQSFDQLAVVRRLEMDFPTLEEAGCKVGIGVATGADKVFIGPFDELDVEPSRKLPLVETKDIDGGTVKWRGRGVINPFEDSGALVDLADFPRLARYFDSHAEVIRKRNCAMKTPRGWYRTIDRITPALLRQPKLLIPDIKGEAHVVYENGKYYPHHNLYYITSKEWDLKALQTVLKSGIAKLFVSIYSTQMRGGYLRFQAQYLRRIRIPPWAEVPPKIREKLSEGHQGNPDACNHAVFDLYRLTHEERAAIGGNGEGRHHGH